MEGFPFFESIVVPVIVSLLTSLITWFVATRKSYNEYRNSLIDEIYTKLDDLHKSAVEISNKPYADEDYQYMVYEVGNLETSLIKTNKDLAQYNFLPLKQILTDHIFHSSDKKDVLNHLSSALQKVKRNLNKRFL